jgi:hypothetical protein
MSEKTSGKHSGDPAIGLLEAAIQADGRGVTRYAEDFLFRSPSTVHKWRRGDHPIPVLVKRMLSPQPLIEYQPTPLAGEDEDD